MASTTEVLYKARIRAPQVLERGRAQVTNLSVYLAGSLAAPSSGTYSLLSPLGTAIVDAAVVTITSSVATYTILAASLPSTLSMGEGYSERWALVMPDGTTRTFAREASLCLSQLSPSITGLDLLSEYPDLLEVLANINTDLDDWIDEGWYQFLGELSGLGEWPNVIVTKSATREPHRQRTLFLIYKFLFGKQANALRYETLMDYHREQSNAAFSAMTYRTDRDQDGTVDSLNRAGSTTVVHRSAAPQQQLARSARW